MLRFRIDLSAFSSEAPHANNETGMRPLRSALLFLTTQCFCENQQSHELANYCTRGGLWILWSTQNPCYPLGPQFCLTHIHRHAKPLCANAFLLHQHPHAGRHTNINSTHTHVQNPHTQSAMHSPICIHTCTHSPTHNS